MHPSWRLLLLWTSAVLCGTSNLWGGEAGGGLPRIFYSDLVSGPASGGRDDRGTIVTITGSGFGAAQGTSSVLLDGSGVAGILSWAEGRISFQIGPGAKSGDIRVKTDQGESNGTPFTVAPGRLLWVSPVGNDAGPGSWSHPWRTITHAVAAMGPGDIAYVMDGARQKGLNGYNAALSIQRSGTRGRPIALVAYPGARVEIGDEAGAEFGVRTPAIKGGPFSEWILAGFTIRGSNTALRVHASSGWRVVNNDFACPMGDGAAGCVEFSQSSYIAFLGNHVHDAGRPGSSKRYQSVYFTTDSNHVEVGWNRIGRNHSCRGLQFHSSPVSVDSGFNQYDLSIHDNRISDQVCDGLNLATVDPSKGAVLVYNNLIYHVGIGPTPRDGESSYACINSPGIVNRGDDAAGTIEITNNTMSDCGAIGGNSAGALSVGKNSPDLMLRNNLIEQRGKPYFSTGSLIRKIHGSSNLWSGFGPGPDETSGNVNATPMFSAGSRDFVLSKQSPAKHAAHSCTIDYDLAGYARRHGDGCSIGAFE